MIEAPDSKARAWGSLVAALAIAAGIAACPTSVSCPSGTTQLGSYTVTYTTLDEGDTCIVNTLPDGGPTDSALVGTPASSAVLLCASGMDGGTPQLYLGTSLLGAPDGSTYAASGTETDISNTACFCAIDISDTISITLATPDGGPFAFNADGGFTAVPSFSGRADDLFQHTSGDSSSCGCNLPCGAHYTMSGTQ